MDSTYATHKERTMLGLAPYMRTLVSKAMDEAFSMGERAALLRVKGETERTESTFVITPRMVDIPCFPTNVGE